MLGITHQFSRHGITIVISNHNLSDIAFFWNPKEDTSASYASEGRGWFLHKQTIQKQASQKDFLSTHGFLSSPELAWTSGF